MKKYEWVADYIKEKIVTGVYPVGKRIPSEEELISSLNISRTPVRRALETLSKEGLIKTVQGSGSFVRRTAVSEPLDIHAILHNEDRYIESRIIVGMRQAIDDSTFPNIRLILKKPGKNTVKQIEILNSLLLTGKGGIICVPMVDDVRSGNRLLGATLRKIEQGGNPVILLDKKVPEYHGSSIMTDHKTGAVKMMEFLYSRKHLHIAVLYSHQNISSVKERLDGVQSAFPPIQEEGGSLFFINLDEAPVTSAGLEKLVKQGITAVFCLECEIALSVVKAAEAAGLSIPDDLSVCSFDDHCFSSFKEGFLTAVSQKLENIGYYAIQLVLDRIQKKTEGNIHMMVEPDIVRRKSVARR